MCICGAKEILADDLIPNMTLRDTISRILESGSSSANSGSSGRLRAQGSQIILFFIYLFLFV